ncbi:exonuclease SbcC [Microbacterium sp. ru370.1]|uniref:AAA family ATPase n=1 Tax=unclassified Microbacterium TaxID=2609290 RepID=UPI0008915D81|nr:MULTISPECIES: SMC family ATPase [unclassified Microbacterium]SDO92159.1 exonuclease SbcC [Microbacterium sp. ru370.1]SIT93325.1 exonuclease SbcC [Microbacterium sp. RU1D]
MKLHRLELEGFGPFLETQIVDFDSFAADGIFLITGRTGAGKSSVLDGVCYALYGGVPRYDGAERRLRSDHCAPDDPTRVTLEFSAVGERWRITRSPEFERPKRRGGGTTKEPHRALLEVRAAEGWTGVAARPVDVAARLDEILGLTQQQFLQVILLAQNRFSRFLHAKNDERLGLLRTLFGTRTFEQYATELDDRRKRAHDALAAEGVEVTTLLDEAERLADELTAADGRAADDVDEEAGTGSGSSSAADRLARVVRAVERAEYRVEILAGERGAADARLDAALLAEREATALRDRQDERRRVRERLEALEGDDERVRLLRIESVRAAEAEVLRPTLEAGAATAAAVVEARGRASAAFDAARAIGEPADVVENGAAEAGDRAAPSGAEEAAEERIVAALADDALAQRADELTASLSRGEAALAAEGELRDLGSEIERLHARVTTAETERDTLLSGRADVPAMLAALEERLAVLADGAARRDAALTTRDEIRHRLDAAREADRLLEARDQADLASLVRSDALQRAVEVWTTLLRRRLEGAAVELAHDLIDGQPCAVCGSPEHPRPAHGDAEPVSDDELAAAEERKNLAAEEDRLASDAARVARDAHALAAARAGGEDVQTLTARLTAAEQTVSEATADAAEHERVRAERTAAADLDQKIARRLDGLGDELAASRQELALARQRAEGLERVVVDARGPFDTVDARQRDLRTRRDAVRELREARTDLARALDARQAADRALDALIADSVFPDAASVAAALRPDAERRRIDALVAEHTAAVASTRQRLLDLELQLVGTVDEPLDLVPFVAEVAAARAAVQAAAASHAAARALAERLRALAQRADAAHASVAALAEEHAVIARLADTVAGRAPNTRRMTLETFVLAAELEEIVAAANLRLGDMSSGRYRLQHTDALAARGAASGLGLEIMDAFTGQCRPPQSLSGGETFLTSLALALGLAEVVTARAGGIHLDTLFIDEGFGSLDDDTLDLAMRTLDELRQGGRTVGVISHVASMKDQLPAQLHVSATPRGPSVIRHDHGLAPV